jgi:RecJ-like exonuclease
MPKFEMVELDCPNCQGAKYCPHCNGAGQTPQPGNLIADLGRAAAGSGWKQRKCPACRGKGTCRQCGGIGQVTQRRVAL